MPAEVDPIRAEARGLRGPLSVVSRVAPGHHQCGGEVGARPIVLSLAAAVAFLSRQDRYGLSA
jgi:hypothetical protein